MISTRIGLLTKQRYAFALAPICLLDRFDYSKQQPVAGSLPHPLYQLRACYLVRLQNQSKSSKQSDNVVMNHEVSTPVSTSLQLDCFEPGATISAFPKIARHSKMCFSPFPQPTTMPYTNVQYNPPIYR
ncbi:hypothetical protein COP2_040168 [Malus domestica]